MLRWQPSMKVVALNYLTSKRRMTNGELGRLFKAQSRQDVLRSDNLAVLPSNGDLICLICTATSGAIVDHRAKKSKFLALNGGCQQNRDRV
jgi:hypothetical protein